MHMQCFVFYASLIAVMNCKPTLFAVHFSRIVPHEIAVEYVGHSESGLSICQGDCRTDDDCLGDLKCFHRENGDPCPPGCRGDCELYNNGRRDFCFDPLDSPIEKNYQFIVSSGNKTFQEAEHWCNARGRHLTSIHSDEENAAALASCSNCWIGLHSTNGAHGDWEWTDGTATEYYHWEAGQPNDLGGDEDCVDMLNLGAGFWNDDRCDAKNRALCSIHDHGDELLGFRLYYGDAVMSCHLKIANIEKVVDTTYFCDVNNMVETTRCANDGMGDVAIEFENPTSYFDLNIESFYIGSSGDDMNLKFDAATATYNNTFVLEPESVLVATINESDSTITDILTREGAAQGLDVLSMATTIRDSNTESASLIDVELIQKDPTGTPYLYQCHHITSYRPFSYEFLYGISQKMSRGDAESWCKDRGLDQASIHSDEENAAALEACPTNDCWIGLHRERSVDFLWSDGSNFDYSNWQPGEPNNDDKNGEKCVVMRPNGKWNDLDCGEQRRPLCSVPFVTPTEYVSCNMAGDKGSAWNRKICPNATESWTLRTDAAKTITVESVSSGMTRTLDALCVPAEMYATKKAIEWQNDDICECGASYKYLLLGRGAQSPNYPTITLSHDDECGTSDFIATAAYSYYTLSLTTCEGSAKSPGVLLSVFVKGSNGNTAYTQINHDGSWGTSKFGIGSQEIGDLIFISFQIDGNPFDIATDICLKKIEWTNNLDHSSLVLGDEYLGHGVFLVNDGYEYLGDIEFLGANTPDQKILKACQGDCDPRGDTVDTQNICEPFANSGKCYYADYSIPEFNRPPGCAGYGEKPFAFCGAKEPIETNYESHSYRQAPSMNGIYLPSTAYLFQVNTMPSSKRTHIDLVIRVCASIDAFTLEDDSGFGVSVSGRNINDEFQSTDTLSLSTGQVFRSGSSRKYALSIPAQFKEINVLSFSQSIANDMTCIDMVEVNGKEAYLTETYLSAAGSDCEGLVEPTECPYVFFAVLTWPICGIEIIRTRNEPEIKSTSNEQLAIAKCSNPNRLFAADCAVSEERSVTTTEEFSLEITESTSNSLGGEMGFSFETSWGTDVKTGVGPAPEVTQKSTFTIGVSGKVTYSQTKTGSEAKTNTSGISTSSTMSCSGSVSVPPLHSVQYTVTSANAVAESTTYSDIRLTKCSAAFQNGVGNESLYIYLYDVPGASKTVSGDSCSVEYSIAEYEPAPMRCDEVAKMTNVELGTQIYAPICNRDSPARWEPCQCGYGDHWTEVNCICVDEEFGVPLAKDNGFGAAVIDTSNASSYDHYSDWCEEHCANSYYPGIVPKKGISAASSDMVTLLLPDSECEGPSCHGSNSSPNTQFDFMDSESMATLIYLAMAALCAVFVVCTLAATALLIFICGKLCPPYRKSQMIAVDHSDCV